MNYKCSKCQKIINEKDIAEIKEVKIKGKDYTDINYQIICKKCNEKIKNKSH